MRKCRSIVSFMKSALMSLVFCVALTPLPVAAQDLPGLGGGHIPGMTFGFDPENPGRVLDELLERGLAFILDHVEITQRYHEGPTEDDIKGELSVRVYPEGKRQPDNSVSGKGSFELSRRLGGLHLRFDLNLTPSPSDRQFEDYL